MRISDWSSDVCSSDLLHAADLCKNAADVDFVHGTALRRVGLQTTSKSCSRCGASTIRRAGIHEATLFCRSAPCARPWVRRSEERRVGKEWFSTCSYRWAPDH